MIKISIFDDHKERREALKLLIGIEQEMECVGDYENCAGIIDALKNNVPDVILMDIDMPEVNGIEGVRLLHQHFPDTLIIMQTYLKTMIRSLTAFLPGPMVIY